MNARTPDLGAVLGGLVLVALAAAVTSHEVFDRSWDWKWYAAAVLLVAGAAVVVTAAVAARGGSGVPAQDEDTPPR